MPSSCALWIWLEEQTSSRSMSPSAPMPQSEPARRALLGRSGSLQTLISVIHSGVPLVPLVTLEKTRKRIPPQAQPTLPPQPRRP